MLHPWSPQPWSARALEMGRADVVVEAGLAAARRIKAAHPDLPVIFTLAHLARLCDVGVSEVEAYARRRADKPAYRTFRLRKRVAPSKSHSVQRRYREISVPSPDLMRLQRWIAQNVLKPIRPHPASYAFHRDGGIVKAAARHVNCTWLVKMDVSDFFDSISERAVYRVFRDLGYGALLSFQMARICTRVPPEDRSIGPEPYGLLDYYQSVSGRLPQGAPTSPALANLASGKLDEKLSEVARKFGWTYTRYADDLAFSTTWSSSRKEARRLVAIVKTVLQGEGLTSNDAKTLIAPPGARRLVLGLQVDGPEPRLTKAFRANLETHLYALTAAHLGPDAHRQARGFASIVGMRRHIGGLLAFAHHVDEAYGQTQYARWNSIIWPL